MRHPLWTEETVAYLCLPSGCLNGTGTPTPEDMIGTHLCDKASAVEEAVEVVDLA